MVAGALTVFQPLSAFTAYTFQTTFDFFKSCSEASVAKMKEMKRKAERNYEISDIGFILLFAVLIAMLLFICCVFMCMGKVGISIAICFIALLIILVAAFMWMNRESQKHQ